MHRHSTAFLSSPGGEKLALIILNMDHSTETQSSLLGNELAHTDNLPHAHTPVAFRTLSGKLWGHASLKICADGAANRLYDSLSSDDRCTMLPDMIRGDLDSLRGDVGSYYRARGVSIDHEEEQVGIFTCKKEKGRNTRA